MFDDQGEQPTMCPVTVEYLTPDTARVTCHATSIQVDEALRQAQAASRKRSNAPRPDANVDTDANTDEPASTGKVFTEDMPVREATRKLAQSFCERVVRENGFRLARPPKVNAKGVVRPGEGFDFTIELELVPKIKLRDYGNLVVTLPSREALSDEAVAKGIRDFCKSLAKNERVDRAIEDEDTVVLSFESFVDGKAYEGSEVTDYSYEMGSLILPSEFEKGLRGMREGERRSIRFTVDREFVNSDLAGKEARFDVTVIEVRAKRLPVPDDELARNFGYAGYAQWLLDMRRQMEDAQERQDADMLERKARAALAECLEDDPPLSFVVAQGEKMFLAFTRSLECQRISLRDYGAYLGISEEKIREDMNLAAHADVCESLALEALFDDRGYEVSDEEIAKTLKLLAEEQGRPDEALRGAISDEQSVALYEMTMHRMATEWLLRHIEVMRI
jgi:trigger factor